jgi:hypothetical protein
MKQKLSVNFSKPNGIPLFKKFALFNSGLVPLQRYERDIETIQNLKAESLRIDLFMGEPSLPFGNIVTGTADDPVYALEGVERWAQLLLEHQVLPYMSWCYIPLNLQVDHNWRTGPTDLEKWKSTLCYFARHFSEKKIRLGYQEVYNEPDCKDVFFTGTWDEYLQIFKYGATGIKGLSSITMCSPITSRCFSIM